MSDLALFRRAVREFPRLLPYFLAFQVVMFLLEQLLGLGLLYLPTPAVLFCSLLSSVVISMISAFLTLGFFRLCLDRMKGRRGLAPWAILGEWKDHRSYIFWVGVFPSLWRAGKRFWLLWLGSRLTVLDFSRFHSIMSYFNVFLVFFSLFFLMLLGSAVRTAYLSYEDKGFWKAVGRGWRRCVNTWPRCIGYQLKFVVSVQLAVRLLNGLIANLIFRFTQPQSVLGVVNMLGGSPTHPGQIVIETVTGWILSCYYIVALASLSAQRYGREKEAG